MVSGHPRYRGHVGWVLSVLFFLGLLLQEQLLDVALGRIGAQVHTFFSSVEGQMAESHGRLR